MAFIFDEPNKYIIVPAPATEVTVQELVNECRDFEDELANLDILPLISAAWKEDLWWGTTVWITCTLLNGWKVKFEDRAWPAYIPCIISGWNLVSSDWSIPYTWSAFVTIWLSSSSSATNQNAESIQYASFWWWVSVDVVNWQPWTSYPRWNQEYPVDNIPNARTIMSERWLKTVFVKWNINLVTWDNIEYIKVVWENPILTTVNIETWADTIWTSLSECRVQWTMDWWITLRECLVDWIDYVNWYIYNCVLTEKPIVLYWSTSTAFIVRCESWYAQTNAPIIDCWWNWPTLIIKKYAGNLILKNKTWTNSIDIDLDSWDIRLDLTTITTWTITVRWDWSVRNNVTWDILPSWTYWTMTLVNDTTPSKEEISASVWNEVSRSLTEWSWLDEDQLHDALDSYLNKDDYKATTTISSNMRGTDNANTVAPDNTKIGQIKTKVDTLVNYNDTIPNAKLDSLETKIDIVDTNVDDIETKVNTLNNYNDTLINTKLDSIQLDTDNIEVKIGLIPTTTLESDERIKLLSLENYDDSLISAQLLLLDRMAKSSQKIVWTQVIMFDEIWELQRWNLSDLSENPSNENVFFRIKV